MQIRVWDVFDSKSAVEVFPHTTDVRAFSFRPDGKEICVATLGKSSVQFTTLNPFFCVVNLTFF